MYALALARAISPEAIAVHVSDSPEEAAEMRGRWERWNGPVPLAIVESPYRVLIAPLVAYLDALDKQ